jgi:uncharacterized protein YegP (UPF0339 family)
METRPMTKLARTMLMMAVLGGLATSTATVAQEKGKADTKKPATGAEKKPADSKKEDTKLGKFEIYPSKKGFRFRIVGADGKNLCGAYKDYASKEDAIEALDEIKAILTKTKLVEAKE